MHYGDMGNLLSQGVDQSAKAKTGLLWGTTGNSIKTVAAFCKRFVTVSMVVQGKTAGIRQRGEHRAHHAIA